MKRNTAIVAAIVAVAVIVAAAVGVMLLNPGGDSGGDQGPGGPDSRPGGPDGTVSGVVVNLGTNESNASAFDDLKVNFDDNSDAVDEPDALCQVAVTNNQDDEIELDCGNFTATLSDGTQVNALNRNTVVVEPNTTVYVVLGFITNGVPITSVTYSGAVEMNIAVNGVMDDELEAPNMVEAPTNLTEIDNLTFEAPAAWMFQNGSNSPMPLFFRDNESVVLAVVIGTNNDTAAVDLSPGNFWLDLGNGTWVQADEGFNNNVVRTLENDTTKPFMLGFRVDDSARPDSIVYWPDESSNRTVRFDISVQPATDRTDRLTLSKVWTEESDDGNMTKLFIELNETGVLPSGDITLMGWSENEGLIAAMPAEMEKPGNITDGNMTDNITAPNATGMVFVFELESGDDITLLQYDRGGVTRYIWLKPVVPQ